MVRGLPSRTVAVAGLVLVPLISLVLMAERHREELRELRGRLCPRCRQTLDPGVR